MLLTCELPHGLVWQSLSSHRKFHSQLFKIMFCASAFHPLTCTSHHTTAISSSSSSVYISYLWSYLIHFVLAMFIGIFQYYIKASCKGIKAPNMCLEDKHLFGHWILKGQWFHFESCSIIKTELNWNLSVNSNSKLKCSILQLLPWLCEIKLLKWINKALICLFHYTNVLFKFVGQKTGLIPLF